MAYGLSKTLGALRFPYFGTVSIQGQFHLLPLVLVVFRGYASIGLSPDQLQASIPSTGLALTRGGFAPLELTPFPRRNWTLGNQTRQRHLSPSEIRRPVKKTALTEQQGTFLSSGWIGRKFQENDFIFVKRQSFIEPVHGADGCQLHGIRFARSRLAQLCFLTAG